MTSAPVLALANFGGGELVIILLIVLLLFGGAKLPQLAKGLGQSIKEFKKAAKEGEEHPEGAKTPGETKKIEPANTPGSN